MHGIAHSIQVAVYSLSRVISLEQLNLFPQQDQPPNAVGCRVLMQKVAKEYMTTMKAAAVQARLKAGQSPIKATATTICQPDLIQQCFAARDGRLLGLLARLAAEDARHHMPVCLCDMCLELASHVEHASQTAFVQVWLSVPGWT